MRMYVDLPDFEDNYEELVGYMVNGNPSGLIAAMIEDINNARENILCLTSDHNPRFTPSAMIEYVIRAALDHELPRINRGGIKTISRICHGIFSELMKRLTRGYDWYNYSFFMASFSYGNARRYGAVSLLLCATPISDYPNDVQSTMNIVSKTVIDMMFGIS